ncbi:MAG TPA: cytochrome-c oxidase, cbb3-type subunit III, partial [Polaromonas sp.]|nr:cytochrome-c oxidase, cbb3-type subunit III [Polaromonas sp.]
MSDFTSNFWSVYVAGISLVGIMACLLLLWFSGKAKVMTANDNTTGHVWDGDLREMNNPLPRWWVWLFVITVVFALIYLALYPGLGNYAGKLGWSQIGQYEAEVAKGNKEVEPLYAKFNGMKPEDVAGDAQAMAIGERLFMNNCSQCHGSDARGSKGFPNLTDADWLHGGSP